MLERPDLSALYSQHPSGHPMAQTCDLFKELFPVSFPELLELLAPHVEELLWEAIDYIGADDFKRIKAAKKPARELVLHVRAHKDDVPLAEALRSGVMKNKALSKRVVANAKAARRVSLPQAPTSQQLLQSRDLLLPSTRHSKTRSLPFRELRHPDEWERDVLKILKDGGAPLVVTFYDSIEFLPKSFVSAMVMLAKACVDVVGPQHASFRKASATSIRERAQGIVADEITTSPTTLILFKTHYKRAVLTQVNHAQVDGLDVERIRKYIFGREQPVPTRITSTHRPTPARLKVHETQPQSSPKSNLPTPPHISKLLKDTRPSDVSNNQTAEEDGDAAILVPIFIDNRLSERALILEWLAETAT
ncbi:hypothetical protein BKA62DRAFT_828181 [Auriculariales sp. MPI-PUGE-AT-0066]|nr:hypothetical protein BKA62DRAFT_828181 [Auriculariales sp. MPI-PUGE-AT-0066]